MTNAEMLKSETRAEFQKEYLRFIESSTMRCKAIVGQLLRYSRQSKLELGLVDVRKVIDETCLFLERTLSENFIAVSKEYDEVPKVESNANELEQVFTNIIMNAIDAIKKTFGAEKGKGNIVIRSYQEGNYLVVEIKDNGEGIPEENINRIFDPFFTTKDVGKGTGLGLSVSQKIITNHNGKIEIDSRVGEGAAFKVKLPVKSVAGKK